MRSLLYVLPVLSLLACSGPQLEEWSPTHVPAAVASPGSATFVQLEVLLVSAEADRVADWVGPDRHVLRVAHLPQARAREVLDELRETRKNAARYAPVVTVAPEEEARLDVVTQRAYVQDLCRLPDDTVDPVIGLFETGLRCRLTPSLRQVREGASRLRQQVELSCALDLTRLVRLQEVQVQASGASATLEIPQLAVARYDLDLTAQVGVPLLVAPPAEGEEQPLILLSVHVFDLEAESTPRAPAAPTPGSDPNRAPGGESTLPAKRG